MHRRGTTLTNIIAIIVCVVIVFSIVVSIGPSTLNNARVRKDRGQLKEIVTTFAIYEQQNRIVQFPVPGKINAKILFLEQMDSNFRGEYVKVDTDNTINLSGWLHSFMIGATYYAPNALVSHNEVNPIVVAKGDHQTNPNEIRYDYTMVDLENDSFWDPLFSGDISGQGRAEGTIQGGVAGVCHTSYANMALCGERLNYWKSGDYRTVIMSSRGPENGAIIGDDFTKSPTLQLYGPIRLWEGMYVTADGATHFTESMWFEGTMYKPVDSEIAIPDSAFCADFIDYENTNSLGNPGGASADTWMVLNIASTATDVTTAWDTLLP